MLWLALSEGWTFHISGHVGIVRDLKKKSRDVFQIVLDSPNRS